MSSVSKDFSKDLVNRIIISKQKEKFKIYISGAASSFFNMNPLRCLHGAKMIWITIWIAIQRCTCLKGHSLFNTTKHILLFIIV